jgi:uncharacterized protein
MHRKTFLRHSSLLAAAVAFRPGTVLAFDPEFPVVRVPVEKRKFVSKAVDNAIAGFQQSTKNKELAWLFGNTFPNTLDTTVEFEMINGKPDTYVITGDIDAMWQRDSSAQVWPYLSLIKEDPKLEQLIAGVINRQATNIIKDPYANAFYKDPGKVGEWKDDVTDMQPGIHERKWEIDSLCYPIRLAYHYWKISGDNSPFDDHWKQAAQLIIKTFREQQRKNGHGPYKFERKTAWATDGVPLGGYGYPAKPVGLIHSMFRPSDDATIFPFLIPANLFAQTSLEQLAELVSVIYKDKAMVEDARTLAAELKEAIYKYGIVNHPEFGKIYAYEVNGYGSYNIMDDANIPSLLALPYLGAVSNQNPAYINTRRVLLSENNPFFFKGKAAEGIGGPHIGIDMIWPLSIIMRGLTSSNDAEIRNCIQTLQHTHGNTGFMHESFHKDDPAKFTRKWFAWANTIFGEFIYTTWKKRPALVV